MDSVEELENTIVAVKLLIIEEQNRLDSLERRLCTLRALENIDKIIDGLEKLQSETRNGYLTDAILILKEYERTN